MVAAHSKRLPRIVSNRNTDIRPPAVEAAATAMAAAAEIREITGCPTAHAHCMIAQLANAKANTAAEVWMKSCRVKVDPIGTGHPAVQLTCESTRKKPLAIAREIEGRHQRKTRARDRMPRPAQAMSNPPAAMSSSTASKTRAVGIPSAPNSLT